MKPKIHRSYHLAVALGCFASAGLTLLADSDREPVTRDNDKPPQAVPAPAPFVDASDSSPDRGYDPHQPYDRDRNRPVRPTPLGSDDNYQTSQTPARSDHRLVQKAAESNDFEIAASTQALTQATNPDVRAYAQMMVTDHGRLENELTTLLTRKGITIDGQRRFQDELNDLSQKTGKDYDEAYIDEMIDSHEEAIQVFEKLSKSSDPDLASFAVQHLPTLREHLDQARQLETAVK